MADVFVANKNSSPAEVLKSPKKTPHEFGLRKHRHHPFASFSYLPDGVKFIAKDPKEKIILLLRRHPITNVGWVLITIVLLFAPAALKIFPILEFLPDAFQLIAVAGWYMITVAFALEKFLDWFFNVCVVTDERIFDVDFVNLIYREISEANIDQIQDVTVKMGGVVRTIFNYGDVFIQTASEVPRIDFEAVSRPDQVAKVLRGLRVEEEQEKIEGRVR